jgi:hypothetical protein
MKKTLIYVSVLAIALVFWFLRAKIDAAAMQTRDAQIASLRDAVQTRDEMLMQSRALTASHADNLQMLKDKLKDAADAVVKDESQIATMKRAQEADQTIIASLKNDNDADIRALKEQIQTKDDQIAQLNERLADTIASYETRLNAAEHTLASGTAPAPPQDDGKKIYPKDDGFDAQSLGTGMFAYQVFSQLNNPTSAPQPPPIPNISPWTFGGTGNSGISANEAFYVSNARNGDHDGKTSQAGQAAFLQFKGSWFSQKIKLPAGTYSVGFDFEAGRDYGEADGIAVSLNGKDVYAGAPTDTNNFSHVTTEIVTLHAAGEYELKFRGLGALNDPGGDHTTFIDNICLNVIDPNKHAKAGPVDPSSVNGQTLQTQEALSGIRQ